MDSNVETSTRYTGQRCHVIFVAPVDIGELRFEVYSCPVEPLSDLLVLFTYCCGDQEDFASTISIFCCLFETVRIPLRRSLKASHTFSMDRFTAKQPCKAFHRGLKSETSPDRNTSRQLTILYIAAPCNSVLLSVSCSCLWGLLHEHSCYWSSFLVVCIQLSSEVIKATRQQTLYPALG